MEQQTLKIRKLVRDNRLNCPKNVNVRASFEKNALIANILRRAKAFLLLFIYFYFRRLLTKFRNFAKSEILSSHLTERGMRIGKTEPKGKTANIRLEEIVV